MNTILFVVLTAILSFLGGSYVTYLILKRNKDLLS